MNGPLCPVTMHCHAIGAHTCDRCDAHVRRYLAWYLARPEHDRELIARGAWIANDSTHFRAMAVAHAEQVTS